MMSETTGYKVSLKKQYVKGKCVSCKIIVNNNLVCTTHTKQFTDYLQELIQGDIDSNNEDFIKSIFMGE